MKVRIWKRGSAISVQSKTWRVYIVSQRGYGNPSVDLIFSARVLSETPISDTLSEYMIEVGYTGKISITSSLLSTLETFKSIINKASEIYVDVPSYIAAVPIFVVGTAFFAGIMVGKKGGKK